MENEQTSSGAINTDLTFNDEKHDSASKCTESDWESGYEGYHADDDDKSLEGDEYIVATTSDGFVSTSLPHEIDKLSLSTPNAASSLPRTSTTTETVLIHSARVSSLDYVPSNSPFEVAPLVQSPSIPSALMPSAMPSASVLSPSIPAPRHKFSFNFWDEDSETEPAGFHLSAPAHQSESTVPSSSVAQPLPQTPASSFKSLSADNQDIEFKDGGFLLSALALKHDFSSNICDEDNQDMDLEDRDFYRSAPLHPSELASHLQHKTSSGQTSGTWKPTWTPKNCFALHLPDTHSSPLRRISTSKGRSSSACPCAAVLILRCQCQVLIHSYSLRLASYH
jgi:hypothetical protein